MLTLIRNGAVVFAGLHYVLLGSFRFAGRREQFHRCRNAEEPGIRRGFVRDGVLHRWQFGATVPASLWNLGGWPACIGLIVSVQLFTMTVAARYENHAG